MKILVIRHDVLGDVFLVSSVFPGLRKKYPDATLDYFFNPGYGDLLQGNPFIDHFVHEDDGSYDLVLPIDHASCWDDWMPKVHCRIAGVDFHPPEIYFTDDEIAFGRQYEGCIALATGAGWMSRRYNHWPEVVAVLKKSYRIVQIDLMPNVDDGIEHARIDIRHGAALVNAAALYLGVDSLFMHVAAACCTPSVVCFGATDISIQYVPCCTALRPKPWVSLFDHEYLNGIELPPEAVIQAVRERAGWHVITEMTDGAGEKTQKAPQLETL